MKRLFIAVNLDEETKKKIEKTVSVLPDLESIRFLAPENWHLTISFLGYQPDEALGPILKSVKETVENFKATTIAFEKIIWAPPDKMPRMIWLCGTKEASKLLGEIKNHLEDSLIKNGVRFSRENRGFNAHLTLARFQAGSIDNLSEIKLPNIDLMQFDAKSLDLMESHLKKTGAEYEILAKLTLAFLQ